MQNIESRIIHLFEDGISSSAAISRDSSFFELGGNSLTAILLLSRLKKMFNVELTLQQFLGHSSINDIIDVIRNTSKEEKTEIKKVDKKPYYRSLKTQEKLFLLQDRSSVVYNIPILIELSGSLDAGRLFKALHQLTHFHEVLRTSFRFIQEEVVQIINEDIVIDIETSDGGAIDRDNIAKTFCKPFYLGNAPLIRAGLIKESKDTHILAIDIHHIITDGISNNIMFEDLLNLYQGKDIIVPEWNFKDYTEWYYSRLDFSPFNKERQYWINRLSNIDLNFRLPRTSTPGTHQLNFSGNNLFFKIDPDRLKGIRQLALKNKSTTFSTLLSIYLILLSRICHHTDILVGIVTSGRTHAEFQRTMGMFAKVIPYVVSIDHELSFDQFLHDVTAHFMNDIDNSEMLVEEIFSDIDIQTVFQLQNYTFKDSVIDGLSWKLLSRNKAISKFDLLFTGLEYDDSVAFEVDFKDALFSSDTIGRIIEHYLRLLNLVLAQPGMSLKEIINI